MLVQLPLYNERYVVERLIDAVAAMDYPADKLTIQVLDDSTDDTVGHRPLARGLSSRPRPHHDVPASHGPERFQGWRTGGRPGGRATPEFVAIFDADFVPPVDFLRRMMPEFGRDPRLAIVQSRWEHLNSDAEHVDAAPRACSSTAISGSSSTPAASWDC